jgi:hypothetical protein
VVAQASHRGGRSTFLMDNNSRRNGAIPTRGWAKASTAKQGILRPWKSNDSWAFGYMQGARAENYFRDDSEGVYVTQQSFCLSRMCDTNRRDRLSSCDHV